MLSKEKLFVMEFAPSSVIDTETRKTFATKCKFFGSTRNGTC